MYQTKGAIGNLINRYRAVLKKCHLLNTFGSLAVAGMLVMGGVAPAMGYAEGTTEGLAQDNQSFSETLYDGTNDPNSDNTKAGAFTINYLTTGVTIGDGVTFSYWETQTSAGGAVKALNGFTIGDNVTFSNNKATESGWGGGALYIKLYGYDDQPSTNQEVIIGTNARFENNEAYLYGGAIALEYGKLTRQFQN